MEIKIKVNTKIYHFQDTAGMWQNKQKYTAEHVFTLQDVTDYMIYLLYIGYSSCVPDVYQYRKTCLCEKTYVKSYC